MILSFPKKPEIMDEVGVLEEAVNLIDTYYEVLTADDTDKIRELAERLLAMVNDE